MRFLVDAQLPLAFAGWPADKGFVAEHGFDLHMETASASEIRSRAKSTCAVIVTKEEDFAALATSTPSGPRVLWVRLGNSTRRGLSPNTVVRSSGSLQVHWRCTSGHETALLRPFCDRKYTPGTLAVHKPERSMPEIPSPVDDGGGPEKTVRFNRGGLGPVVRSCGAGENMGWLRPAGENTVPKNCRNALIEREKTCGQNVGYE